MLYSADLTEGTSGMSPSVKRAFFSLDPTDSKSDHNSPPGIRGEVGPHQGHEPCSETLKDLLVTLQGCEQDVDVPWIVGDLMQPGEATWSQASGVLLFSPCTSRA